MSWFPFKFCRVSTAARLDRLEQEIDGLRGDIHLLRSLEALTFEVAKLSTKPASTIRGRCDSCKTMVERPESEWVVYSTLYTAPHTICPRCGGIVHGAHRITPKGGSR